MKSLINVEAAEWASLNAGLTYPDLTKEQTEIIRRAVTTFVKKSGFTVGDVIKLLLPYFSDERAELIASTEITRAYAHAAQIRGEKLRKEFPDVPVIKYWTTNNDDNVCLICSSLEGKEVDITEEFAEGIFIPPAHEGCRCWIESSTAL